jgi:pimeloyl-ACP methyl ester carboxylesterase
VFVHGPKSDSWYWHRVVPRIVAAGHDAIAVDLPVENEIMGLADYATVVADTVRNHPHQTIVTHSMAAFIAPMIAGLVEVEMIILVAPMVPRPGETALQWIDNTGQRAAARRLAVEEGRTATGFSVSETYLHDVPVEVAEEFGRHTREQAMRPFQEPWPLDGWPSTPTTCVVGRHDRLYPYEFQCRVVAERLGIVPRPIDGGHLCALSAPDALTEQLVGAR